jgi:hypothetical protein
MASKYSGDDGSSVERAVIINEKNEYIGVAAEYAWLRDKHPDYTLFSQMLMSEEGKHFDLMIIKSKEGISKRIYFDISNFFESQG